MSYVDTMMERKNMGLIGSYKVTVELRESMITALVLTSCISQGFRAHTAHTLCLSGTHSLQNITASGQIIRAFRVAQYNDFTVIH